MPSPFGYLQSQLVESPKKWLVTGGAGPCYISHRREASALGSVFISLNNYSNGYKSNLESAIGNLSSWQKERLRIREGDFAEYAVCEEAVA
jgi:UDP-N-acetylglucosamine 4-epimerase